MPLTHDIGVRIPYPLLKQTTSVVCFFLHLLKYIATLSGTGWELAHKNLTPLPHSYEVVPPFRIVQKQKKGQPFDYPSWRCVGDSNCEAIEPIHYKKSADRRSSNKSSQYRLNPKYVSSAIRHNRQNSVASYCWDGNHFVM